jgi:hypothetical protein
LTAGDSVEAAPAETELFVGGTTKAWHLPQQQ